MRIAQVAPLYEAVPPGTYGGTERVIAGLCDGLVAQRHEVTLFAPETSETAAKLEAYGEPLRARFGAEKLVNLAPHLHLQMLADLYERSDEFDVVHSHLDIWTYPLTRLSDVPTVLTMHGRLDLDFVRDLMPRYGSVPLVWISDDQRRAVADLDLTWAATVYNGLDLSAEGRTGEAGVAYLVLGKIGYIGKGIAIAIVGGLMLVGALTHDESQSGNLDHALRTLLTYPFGQTLVVVIAAGMLCFGIFCLARARHLSRAHVRTTAPISPSPVGPNHRRRT